MQFMSQSTGWADNIILAMVPLGIVTAIVGAIRVGGPSWLKAIVGRARESRAVAESELMSSVSKEVCELWNGQEIVRVMGEGPIREFIILMGGDCGAQRTTRRTPNQTPSNQTAPTQTTSTRTILDQTPSNQTPLNHTAPTQMAPNQTTLDKTTTTGRTESRQIGAQVQVIKLKDPVHGHRYLKPYSSTFQDRIFGQHLPGDTEKRKLSPGLQDAGSSEPELQKGPAAVIRNAGTAIRDLIFGKHPQRDPEQGQPDPDPQEFRSVIDSQKPNDSPSPEPQKGPVAIVRNTAADAPNLTLNVHNQVGRRDLYVIAACGLTIQLGILVYFGIIAKHLTLILLKDGKPVVDYAFPCTAAGTLLLVAGMLICAYIIESSTEERRYCPKDGMEARIVWLQRSGTVNDQSFESYAIFPEDAQALVTTSQQAPRRKLKNIAHQLWHRGKNPSPTEAQERAPRREPRGIAQLRRRRNIPNFIEAKDRKSARPKKNVWERLWESEVEEVVTVAGTMLTISGFVVQFVGLRGMHWSASVAQLGATILMTTLRAWVRRNLAKNPKSRHLVSGYEMDWLAMIVGEGPKLSSWLQTSEPGKATQSSPPRKWIVSAIQDPKRCKKLMSKDEGTELFVHQQSRAYRVMKMRRDLGRLADWHGLASAEAICLARAIEIAMDALLPALNGKFTWSLDVGGEPVHFRLERGDSGAWKAQSDELDAALSLWLYSVDKDERGSEGGNKTKSRPQENNGKGNEKETEGENKNETISELRREVDDNDEDDDDDSSNHDKRGGSGYDNGDGEDDTWLRAKGTPAKRSLRLLGSHTPGLRQNLQWWMPDGDSRVIEVEKHQGSRDSSPIIVAEPHRISGCLSSPGSRTGPYRAWKPPDPPDENASMDASDRYSTYYSYHSVEYASDDASGGASEGSAIDYSEGDAADDASEGPVIDASEEGAADDASDVSKEGASDDTSDYYSSSYSGDDYSSEVLKYSFDDAFDDTSEDPASEDASDDAPEDSAVDVSEHASDDVSKSQTVDSSEDTTDGASEYPTVDDWPVLAAESYTPLRKFFAQHMFSTFMQAAAKTMKKPISGEADVRPAETDGPLAWQSFTLHNAQFSRMVQDIQGTGLGSLEEVCLGVIPPLSAENKLPRPDAIIELARKYAAPYERRGEWKRAIDAYSWLLEKAEMFPKHGNITTRAVPLLMESLRTVTDAIELGEVQQFGHTEMSELRWCERELGHMLRNIGVDEKLSNIMWLYGVQGRPWKSPFIGTRKRPIHDDAMLKSTGLRYLDRSVSSGGSGNWIEVAKEGLHLDKYGKDILDWTPLHYYASTDLAVHNPENIPQMLRHGGNDINARDIRGRTPLGIGCRRFNKQGVHTLIQKGADINVEDRDGMTPLHVAVIHGHIDIVKLLVERGANIDAVDNFGNTALHWAAFEGQGQMIDDLWGDANRRIRNSHGRTPLHLAAMGEVDCDADRKEAVQILLQKGADKEAKDGEGQTPLHIAATAQCVEIIQLLVEEGANIESDDLSGRTPLHIAAESGHTAVQLLLEKGAEMEAVDLMCRTALHIAAEAGHIAVVQLLLEKGANKEEIDTNVSTPLSLAIRAKHWEVCKLLRGQ